MPQYRRARIEGGTYFFTVCTYQRRKIFVDPLARSILHDVLRDAQTKRPFRIIAICLLPDHLHCVWTLPENDADYSMRWHFIKRFFTMRYSNHTRLGKPGSVSRQVRKESVIWQRRFFEHVVRDEHELNQIINYIHFNPLKHGVVSKLVDWEWSSFHRYVKQGYYESDWGNQDKDIFTLNFGLEPEFE